MTPPAYLYKILSLDNWAGSAASEDVALPSDDTQFIHLSTQEQLEKITSKYWKDVPEYILLKLEVSKLKGKLILEANPGGSNKYYHLYDGSIPKDAIVETRHIIEVTE
ncbi:MAG: DUF952 domain-containing protein [Parachlamydiales bacterium]|jgi:uncharacterized protein (DUF952 family)